MISHTKWLTLGALLIVGTFAFAAGNQEMAATSGDGVTFTHAHRWDNDDGRLSLEEQPDDPYFQYVLEQTGAAPLTTGWDWGGSSGYIQNLRLALAAGETFDAYYIRDIGLMKEMIDNNQVLALDGLLKDFAPKVYDYFGEAGWQPVRQVSSDGANYYVPGLSPRIGVRTGFIRKDWLDRVGLPIPTTRDELVEVYRAFRDQDANGNGDAGDEIPVSGREGLRWLDDLFIMHGVDMFEGHPRWSWDDESEQMISHQVSDQMREALIFIRELIEEGLMDPVMPVQQNADWTAKLNAGRIGHYFHLVRALHTKSAFVSDEPDAEWAPLPLIQAPGVEPMKYPYPKANYVFPDFAIGVNAENPEAIMKWFNWSKADEAAFFYHELGIPGVHWERDADGGITILDSNIRDYKYHAGARNNINIDLDLTRLSPLGDTKVEAYDLVLNKIGTEPLDDDGMPISLYGEEYDDFRPDRATLYREVASKIVLGIEPVSAWDDYVEQWYDLGGAVMTERATQWYRETMQ